MSNDITGTDVIRQALKARGLMMNLAPLAKDLGIPTGVLENFCAGRDIDADIKSRLVQRMWNGSAIYDAERDALRSANREPPRPLGTLPTFSSRLPKYRAGPAQAAPQPVNKKPVSKPRRAGWVE